MTVHIRLRTTHPTRTKWMLRGSQYICFLLGILALGYCVFELLETQFYQHYMYQTFQQTLAASKATAANVELFRTQPLPAVSLEPNRTSIESVRGMNRIEAPLGQIEIEAIGVKAMILEGTDARTLRRAVGHIPGTPMPGQSGNVAIAGHRDTFFRGLRNIHIHDEIMLTTGNGSFRYLVDYVELVGPENIEVLNDSDESVLTLVTCYPFYYVGPAPKRFVVRAHMAPM